MKKNVIYFAAMMLTWGFISCSEDIASEIDETMIDSSKVIINEATNPKYLIGKWELTKCFFGDVDHIKDTSITIYPVKVFHFKIDDSFKTGSTVNCIMCGNNKDSFFPKWEYNIASKSLYFYDHQISTDPYSHGYYNTSNCVVVGVTMTIVRKQLHIKKGLVEYKMVYVKKTDY